MSQPPPASRSAASELGERLEELGRKLGSREAPFREDLERARRVAARLREQVAGALARFHRAAAAAGALQLDAVVSETRADDKHLRAVQFDLSRGRYRAIVTVKARGEVTLEAHVSDEVKTGILYTTFHFPEHLVNVITSSECDEHTLCPEYKVVAVDVAKVAAPAAQRQEPALATASP